MLFRLERMQFMKVIRTALALLLPAVMLSACGASKGAGPAEQSGESPVILTGQAIDDLRPVGLSAYMDVTEGDNVFRFYKLYEKNGGSEAVRAFNERVDQIVIEAVAEANDESRIVQYRSFGCENNRYISVLVHRIVYPSFGTQGKVQALVYDLWEDELVHRPQGENIPMLTEQFKSLLDLPEGEQVTAASFDAYYLRQDGSAVYVVVAAVDNHGADPYSAIFVFDPGNNTAAPFDPEGSPLLQ